MKEYDVYQTQIEVLDKNDKEREQIETQFFNLKVQIQMLMTTNNRENSSNTANARPPSQNNTLSIPVLNLPVFSGAYFEWLSFYDLFNSIIHENLNLMTAKSFTTSNHL